MCDEYMHMLNSFVDDEEAITLVMKIMRSEKGENTVLLKLDFFFVKHSLLVKSIV